MLSFIGIGWEKRLREFKREYSLALSKELILGNALRKGENLFYFLVKYQNRNAILVFLDGKDLQHKDEFQLELKQFVMKE